MTRYQTIADCLRCSASSKPTRDCIGCPYDIKEELPELFAGHPELLESDGYCHSCDVDRMANDAADAIEQLSLAEKTSNKEREA